MGNCFFCGEWLSETDERAVVTVEGRNRKVHQECADYGEDYWREQYRSWCEANGVRN